MDRVLQAPSVDAVNELLERGITGDLAIVSLAFGSVSNGLIKSLRHHGWPRVVAVTSTAAAGPLASAINAGVSGVLRPPNSATSDGPSGVYDLSPREIEVLRLVADGRSNKWIGDELMLSSLTVKAHLKRIGRKLEVGDRAGMVAVAMRARILR
jgi:DNA-binding CsgD family transcriptional regulator